MIESGGEGMDVAERANYEYPFDSYDSFMLKMRQ